MIVQRALEVLERRSLVQRRTLLDASIIWGAAPRPTRH
jgi:hypothetical protein